MELFKTDGYKIINIKNKKILFDIFNMYFCEISEDLAQNIINNEYKKICNEDYVILNNFADNNIFFYNTRRNFPEINNHNRINFSLAPIHKCNLMCKYCFADYGENFKGINKKLDKKTIIDIGEFILKNFGEYERFRLDFVSGGEPLYDKELLKYIITVYRNMFSKKDLFIWLCTNSTLNDEEILMFLDKNKVLLGISIDGDKSTNDKNRIYANGQGTYDDIIKSVNLIKNSCNLSKNIKSLWGLSVITNDNNNLLSIVRNHYNLGFSSIQMKFVRLEKNNKLSINENNISKILIAVDELLNCAFYEYENDISNILLLFLNQNDYIGKYLWSIISQQPYSYRCEAARAKFAFAADGLIYPCDSFVGNTSFCIGDIYNGFNEKKNLFLNKSIADRDDCKNCWARFVCSGDCFHNSYISNQDICIPDYCFCHYTRTTISLCLFYLLRLQENSPSKFNQLKQFISIRKHIKK